MAHGKHHFDLSKFSYDAARAGVVPSLGDCAMASRRSSTCRARGWSSASFEPGDDAGIFGSSNISSIDIPKPERQPAPPPAEHLADKDIGFAKFLKTHSSPTHNRVTAGGRIVPMEKREAQPRFPLFESERPSGGSDGNPQGASNPGRFRSPNDEPQKVMNGPQLRGHTPGHNEASTENLACPEINTLSTGQMLGNGCYFPPQVPLYLGLQSPMLYQGYAGGLSDWPNCGMVNAPGGIYADAQLQSVYTTGQMVQDAEALFNNLNRQLRLIDRHRAMMSHDPNLAAQRMAVVQQRAECKEQIQRLKAQLQAEQSRSAYFHPMSFSSSGPGPFVPVATTAVQQQHPAASPASTATSTIRPNVVTEKRLPVTKRKVIPIVPPPPPSPMQAEPCKKAIPMAKPKAKLQHRNSGRASQSNGGGTSSHTLGRASTALQESSVNYKTKTEAVGVGVGVAARDGKRETEDKRQGRQSSLLEDDAGQEQVNGLLGRPPDNAEAIYELQLDAMRLPEGVNVIIALSNGARVSVPGSRLGRPRLWQMSDFEKQYWGRKPKFTMEMLENIKARATIQSTGGCPTSDEYLVSNADGPPATPPRKDVSRQNLTNEQSSSMPQKTYSPAMVVDVAKEPSPARAENRVASAGATAAVPVTGITGKRGNESMQVETNQGGVTADEMSQKGYSSVLVQNVNVEVQLPPPGLDGATDPNGRSAAVLSLAATGKQRSPRVVRQSTPNGGAWYGPHCRKVREQVFSDGNH